MTISVLAQRGHSGRAIARMLGVTEHAVRYHLERQRRGAVDGRARQAHHRRRWQRRSRTTLRGWARELR